MSADIPLKTRHQTNYAKYFLIECNHESHKHNQDNRLSGDQYEYKPIFRILHQTNDLNECIVELNKTASNAVEDKSIKADKIFINDRTVEVFDRTKGWFSKNNKHLFSFCIVEC